MTEDEPRDVDELARHADALAEGIDAAIVAWTVHAVEQCALREGRSFDEELRRQAVRAGESAQAEISPKVRALLEQDIDEQRTNPLSVLRSAVRFPTAVLQEAGVAPVERDREAERLFPDDLYDLTPASFGDISPDLVDLGISWGAAKAYVHLKRRKGGSGH